MPTRYNIVQRLGFVTLAVWFITRPDNSGKQLARNTLVFACAALGWTIFCIILVMVHAAREVAKERRAKRRAGTH